MFLSNETLSALIALGAPPEKLAAVLRMIERDAESIGTARRRTTGAERQRRYRERKASQIVTDASLSVTVCHQASQCDVSLSPSPPPQTPPPRPHTRGDISSRAREADRFAEFWDAYPVKKSKPQAERAYRKALARTDHGTLIASLNAQRTWPNWRDGFIPHAATWLNNDRWADEPSPSPRQAGHAKPEGNRPKPTGMAEIIARRRADSAGPVDVPAEWRVIPGGDPF